MDALIRQLSEKIDGDAESSLARRLSSDGPLLDRALARVRSFIEERGLVVFGGFAIDSALRQRGGRIYPDDERPDYDFLSPRSVDDAYDLADLLHAEGFPDVDVVRAIHLQTMRVRVSTVCVADVGYAPRSVFEGLPTIASGQLRIIHPDFQRMDMHLAFCFPYQGAPREDVFHRWRKDLRRFNLVDGLWPIASRAAPGASGRCTAAELCTPVAAPLDSAAALEVALHGFAAYSLLCGALEELLSASGDSSCEEHRKEYEALPKVALSFQSTTRFTVQAEQAHLATSLGSKQLFGDRECRFNYPFMDVVPATATAGDVVALSTRNGLLAVSVCQVTIGGVPHAVKAVSPQYLLLLFLSMAHRSSGRERDEYLAFYTATLRLLRIAESAALAGGLQGVFCDSPFAPSVRYMGGVNHNTAYLVNASRSYEAVRRKEPDYVPDFEPLDLTGVPKRYEPGRREESEAHPPFSYENSCVYYRRSGEPSDSALF